MFLIREDNERINADNRSSFQEIVFDDRRPRAHPEGAYNPDKIGVLLVSSHALKA